MIFSMLELVAVFVIPLFILLQLVFPLIFGGPLFPAFRRRWPEGKASLVHDRELARKSRMFMNLPQDLSTDELIERGMLDEQDRVWFEKLKLRRTDVT